MYIWQNKAKIMKLIKGEPLNDSCLDISVAVGVNGERLGSRSRCCRTRITNKEAKQLFSSMADDYAFGEMDEAGKDNIADFAGM
jgi:hypothetical protein